MGYAGPAVSAPAQSLIISVQVLRPHPRYTESEIWGGDLKTVPSEPPGCFSCCQGLELLICHSLGFVHSKVKPSAV